jgi:hypothetical protein
MESIQWRAVKIIVVKDLNDLSNVNLHIESILYAENPFRITQIKVDHMRGQFLIEGGDKLIGVAFACYICFENFNHTGTISCERKQSSGSLRYTNGRKTYSF